MVAHSLNTSSTSYANAVSSERTGFITKPGEDGSIVLSEKLDLKLM